MGCSWPFWSDKLITLKFYGYFEHCTVVYLVRGRSLTTSTKFCPVLTPYLLPVDIVEEIVLLSLKESLLSIDMYT